MNMALKQLENQKPTDTMLDRLEGAGKLIFALVFTEIFLTVLKGQNYFIITLLGQRIRHGINGLVFQKVMEKSIDRDTTFSLGEITNITQVDTNKIADMGDFVNRIIIAPIEIIIGVVWIYLLVGWKPLAAGLAMMFLFLFFNGIISRRYKTYRTKFMDAKDKRGKLITEVFSNIRFIKMCGLENYFLEKITEYKRKELFWIEKQLKRGVYSITINNAAPIMFLVALFGTYIWVNGAMDIPTIFTVMQVYSIFRSNFTAIPYMLIWVMDIAVSGQRISFFLLSENIDSSYIKRFDKDDDIMGDNAIEISDGNFYWEDKDLKKMYKEEKDRIAEKGKKSKKKSKDEKKKEEDLARKSRAITAVRSRISSFSIGSTLKSHTSKGEDSNDASLNLSRKDFNDESEFENFTLLTNANKDLTQTLLSGEVNEYNMLYAGINLNLRNINLKIKKGQCVALIGKVGSGKSSLLSCLSGEMYHKLGSEIRISGDMAYVSQKAWIMSKSIKENILFEKDYDEQRYNDSIKYSCMTDDLKIFNKGGETQLGDKGINLSGGQKIRLSIARAMYADKEIYLFDDPISALDIHVGKYVMEEGILNYLKGKTRIVATHAIAYLKFFDYIYVLDEGEIIAKGTFAEIEKSDAFKEIKKSLKKEEEEEKKNDQEKLDEASQVRKESLNSLDNMLDHEIKENNENEDDENKKNEGEKEQGEEEEKEQEEANDKEDMIKLQKDKEEPKKKEEETEEKKLEAATKGLRDPDEKKAVEDIIKSEDRAKGTMSWGVVKQWLSLSGGFPRYLFICIIMSVWSFTSAGIPWFLQWYSTNYAGRHDSKNEDIKIFLGIYLSINGIQLICDYMRASNIFMGNVELAKEVNFLMSFRLMHASISKYFDRVPLGRILNRFMSDIEIVDFMLAWSTSYIFWTG